MKKELITKLLLSGSLRVVHKDKFGNVISDEPFEDLITKEGLDYLLNVGVHGGTQISDWFFAPFENDYTPTADDTYATPGYTETAKYSETTRQAWDEGASSGQSITNATAATITANADVTIYGAGIVGGGTAADTIQDTAGGGILLASGVLTPSSKTLANGETLDLTYTLNGASS